MKPFLDGGPDLFPEQAFLGDEVDGGSPKGAGFDSPGRVSLGYGSIKAHKPQRGEIPVWCNRLVANGITPLQGSGPNSYRDPGLRFAAPWAIESRPYGADVADAGINPGYGSTIHMSLC